LYSFSFRQPLTGDHPVVTADVSYNLAYWNVDLSAFDVPGVVAPATIPVSVAGFDADGNEVLGAENTIEVNGDCLTCFYRIANTLPANVVRVELRSPDDYVLTPSVFDLDAPVGAFTLSVAPRNSGWVTVDLSQTAAGVPSSDAVSFEVIAYEFDPANWANDPPYTELTRYTTDPVTLDAAGRLDADLRVPAAADVVNVVVHAGGEVWPYGVPMVGGAGTLTAQIDIAAPVVDMVGAISFDATCVAAFGSTALTVLRLTAIGTDDVSTPIPDVLVVPDPVTQEMHLRVNIPSNTRGVLFENSFPDAYGNPPNNNGGIFGLSVPPGNSLGFGTRIEIGC
jgi:hypothetical protein